MNRLQSIPLWTAILGLVYIIARDWFNFEIPAWSEISAQVLAILAILFGITNNPTNPNGF